MQNQIKNRLIILAGPSCVGKSPLSKVLQKFHPEISEKLQPLVLYNSRSPRPGEIEGIDYHFRERNYIEKLDDDPNFVVMDVRGYLQALDIEDLSESLRKGSVLFEGNPFVGDALRIHPSLSKIEKLDIFMSPLTKDELDFLERSISSTAVHEIVTDVMRRKLLRRTKKQKSILSIKDLENIEKRASSAYKEIKMASNFNHVIPNHDGEDSDNWDAFYYPLGDARKSLSAFVSLIEGKIPDYVENWTDD
jgi:guanylate kinase